MEKDLTLINIAHYGMWIYIEEEEEEEEEEEDI